MERYQSVFEESEDKKYKTKYENDGEGGTKPVRVEVDDEGNEIEKDEACKKKK